MWRHLGHLTDDSIQRADGGIVSLAPDQQEAVEAFEPAVRDVLKRMRTEPDSGRLTVVATKDFKRNNQDCIASATIYPDDERPGKYRLFVAFKNKRGQAIGFKAGEIDLFGAELEKVVVDSGWEVVPRYCMRETFGFGRLVTLPE